MPCRKRNFTRKTGQSSMQNVMHIVVPVHSQYFHRILRFYPLSSKHLDRSFKINSLASANIFANIFYFCFHTWLPVLCPHVHHYFDTTFIFFFWRWHNSSSGNLQSLTFSVKTILSSTPCCVIQSLFSAHRVYIWTSMSVSGSSLLIMQSMWANKASLLFLLVSFMLMGVIVLPKFSIF